MTGIELLNNTGIQFIGNQEKLKNDKKTFIVVGVARGGTSLIAGTLNHLGIFGGDASSAPVFEDMKLAMAFEKNHIVKAGNIIKEYNEKHTTWYFKRPASINYNDKLDKMCRNPIYLFIFKDIFSVSNRNSISMKLNIIRGLKKAHDDYSKIIEFISQNNLTGFLFSYEKIMLNKNSFVDTLIEIIGIKNIREEQKISALNFIEPNPKAYLDASRITKSKGQIGGVEETKVSGWGKYAYSHEPAEVELYINDKLIATTIAKDFRQHLIDDKIHPTGHCGYHFDLRHAPLKDGDKVAVKVKDDIIYLRNSNQIFKK